MQQTSHRVQKFEKQIQQLVAQLVNARLKPYLLNMVTVQRVEMPPDLKTARVFCSFFGAEDKVQEDLEILADSAREFQHEMGRSLKTKFTPRLTFVHDKGLAHLFFVEERLREIKSKAME